MPRPPDTTRLVIRISVILLSGQGRRQGSREIGLLLVYRTITNAEGARALHLSVRQFQRLKRRLAAKGPLACGTGCAPGHRPGDWPRQSVGGWAVAAPMRASTTATRRRKSAGSIPLSRSSVRRLRRARQAALGEPAGPEKKAARARTGPIRSDCAGQVSA